MSDEIDLRVALALAQKDAAEAKAEVKELRDWLQALEERSGLMSDSLVTRSFVVWGYYLMASLMISMPIGLVVAVVIVIARSG